jgi:1-acyl-sn-glycerol-3-phosphate acyltransferase
LVYDAMRVIIGTLLRLIARPEIVGRSRFPDPPYILATNHLSAFDLPVLLIACPHTVRAFVADKHKRNPPYALLVTIMSAIWIRRGEVDRQALREALEVLQGGGVLGIAPEGTRSRETQALQPGKVGTAYLATRADVPIVPVGISGTEQIRHRLGQLRRTDVRLAVGEPFRLPDSGRVRGQQLEEYTDLIMRRIAELLPEQYRGVYG